MVRKSQAGHTDDSPAITAEAMEQAILGCCETYISATKLTENASDNEKVINNKSTESEKIVSTNPREYESSDMTTPSIKGFACFFATKAIPKAARHGQELQTSNVLKLGLLKIRSAVNPSKRSSKKDDADWNDDNTSSSSSSSRSMR